MVLQQAVPRQQWVMVMMIFQVFQQIHANDRLQLHENMLMSIVEKFTFLANVQVEFTKSGKNFLEFNC